jgi:hypothetical protein
LAPFVAEPGPIHPTVTAVLAGEFVLRVFVTGRFLPFWR